MISTHDLLNAPILLTPEMCEQEMDVLAGQMVERSFMTRDFLAGLVDAETYFDYLSEQEIDPYEIVAAFVDNAQFAIENGLPIETNAIS
jgi:hypothetical protein